MTAKTIVGQERTDIAAKVDSSLSRGKALREARCQASAQE
jgi:hypothetical protein